MKNMPPSPSVIPCITLTTDFGLADEYVGVVKGVILRSAPGANIVDLCHSIAPQNILQAAYLLETSCGFFPDNTLHVVVVDPGVGTDRRILWANIGEHFFLAPDNGVLTLLLQNGEVKEIRTVTSGDLFLTPVSPTFHGRDIFAPVAGKLVAGLDPSFLGSRVAPESATHLALPGPKVDTRTRSITGHVTGKDHFGNLHTDIHLRQLQKLADNPDSLIVFLGDHCLGGLRRHYRQTQPGVLFPLLGSRNYLEIAASMASAATLLPEAMSLPVTVKRR